ncbi:hypothetical protein [Rhizobium sp. BR 249]
MSAVSEQDLAELHEGISALVTLLRAGETNSLTDRRPVVKR